jgi:hypothetical protein
MEYNVVRKAGADGKPGLMSRIVTSTRLTTCGVVDDGRAVRLEFLDSDGQPVGVEFPFDQAESVVMTLPRMLSKALQQRTRDPSSRYVFPLGRWSIESCSETSLIVTLCTEEGFQVSFAIPLDASRAIAQVLRHEGEAGMGQDGHNQSSQEPRLLN